MMRGRAPLSHKRRAPTREILAEDREGAHNSTQYTEVLRFTLEV